MTVTNDGEMTRDAASLKQPTNGHDEGEADAATCLCHGCGNTVSCVRGHACIRTRALLLTTFRCRRTTTSSTRSSNAKNEGVPVDDNGAAGHPRAWLAVGPLSPAAPPGEKAADVKKYTDPGGRGTSGGGGLGGADDAQLAGVGHAFQLCDMPWVHVFHANVVPEAFAPFRPSTHAVLRMGFTIGPPDVQLTYDA